jgi:hypothetical protein
MEKSVAFKKAEATLPESLREQFEMLVEDYRGAAVIYTKVPFVNYPILAALVEAGWRRTTPRPARSIEQ